MWTAFRRTQLETVLLGACEEFGGRRLGGKSEFLDCDSHELERGRLLRRRELLLAHDVTGVVADAVSTVGELLREFIARNATNRQGSPDWKSLGLDTQAREDLTERVAIDDRRIGHAENISEDPLLEEEVEGFLRSLLFLDEVHQLADLAGCRVAHRFLY